MSKEILSALVSAIVALITASLTGYFTWLQIRRDRAKWVIELKASYNLELYKVRLASYPEIFEVIGELSNRAPEPLTPDKAKRIAQKVNAWLYSGGGLCASKETRGALLGIRETCLGWHSEPMPSETHKLLYDFRNTAQLMLRRDIDVKGVDSYNFGNLKSMLEELKDEVSLIK